MTYFFTYGKITVDNYKTVIYMAKMGRPRIEISKEEFEKLCSICCTLTDIAGFFDCSEDTIENWCKREYGETFSDVYKKKSSGGKVSLRRKQYEVAMKGDRSMLIWLGKQMLGQKEVVENTNTDKVVFDFSDLENDDNG